MKIQYASDLHLEFRENSRYLKENPLIPIGDILILAGDIGYLNDENYSRHPFWDWVSENFSQTYIVIGNHELYKYYDLATMSQGLVCSIRSNVNAYYNHVILLDNIDIILSTLWAKIPSEDAYITERGVSDFHRIAYKGRFLTWDLFNAEHEKCLEFIKDSPVSYWIYGHSHRNIDKQIGNTQCVSNQLGYVHHGEHLSFNGAKMVEIPDYTPIQTL